MENFSVRMKIKVWLHSYAASVFVLLSISTFVLGQVGTSNIKGTVVDSNGSPIPSATVKITSDATGFERTIQTTEQGTYSFSGVPAGTYTIGVVAGGFEEVRGDHLVLESNTTRGVNFTLGPAQVVSSVSVEGDLSAATVTNNIDQKFIDFPGRIFLDLPFLISGARKIDHSVALNGVDNEENRYLIDGSDTTDARTGGPAALPALIAVSSLQTISGNFSADIGRLSTASLNIAVKSGSNQFHGSGLFNFRDDSLQAKGPFGGPVKPASGSQHFAFSLGGPLKKDRAFFFVAFDRTHNNQPVTSGMRDVVRRRIVQNFAASKVTSTNFTTKIDTNPSDWDGVSARYSLVDGGGLNPGISQAARLQNESNFQSQKDRQHQLTLSWSHGFTNTLNNFALFNFLTLQKQSAPVTTAPQIVFPSINIGGNFQADQNTQQRRLQLRDDVMWLTHNHTLRFGTDYNHLSLPQPNNFNLFGLGIIFVPCDFAGDLGCPQATRDADIPIQFALINRQTLTAGLAPFGTRGVIPAISDNVIGLYFQDNVKLSRDLNLNLGLRWDYDQDYIGRDQVNKARPGRRKSRKKDLQPRLGIVWIIGKVIIRGGYGTHFQQNFLETRQFELLADGERLPLQRFFAGTLNNPFPTADFRPDIFATSNDLEEYFAHSFSLATETEVGQSLTLSTTLTL
jgi:hypothetical protein